MPVTNPVQGGLPNTNAAPADRPNRQEGGQQNSFSRLTSKISEIFNSLLSRVRLRPSESNRQPNTIVNAGGNIRQAQTDARAAMPNPRIERYDANTTATVDAEKNEVQDLIGGYDNPADVNRAATLLKSLEEKVVQAKTDLGIFSVKIITSNSDSPMLKRTAEDQFRDLNTKLGDMERLFSEEIRDVSVPANQQRLTNLSQGIDDIAEVFHELNVLQASYNLLRNLTP